MIFQSIKPVEDYRFYLDLAFRRAREKGKKLRQRTLKGGRLEKSRYIELLKMQVVADTISSRMDSLVKSFPRIDELPEFYREMVNLHLDYRRLKKSLAAVNWLRRKAQEMFRIYNSKMTRNKQFERINILKKEYLGRVSSLVRQIRNELDYIEQARRILKEFPIIKDMPTVVIVGFPNVGKTTLLQKLTGSAAEIDSYAFTTKGVNVGYRGDIQILDVPGTLDRYDKMNNIEKVAYLAIKHFADMIVFVFDPTEEYSILKQKKLYKRIIDEFKKEVLVYISKTDMAEEEKVEEIKKENKKAIVDAEALADEIKKKK